MRVEFSEGALRYAGELGWKVFPLAAGWKVPAIKGGGGCNDASCDADQIRAWGRAYPNANIGVACGEASRIAVVDVDPRHGGDASIRLLAAKGRAFPQLPRARTGNGGWHLLLQHHERVTNSKNKLGSGIDVKSTGGYVVAAPSWTRKSDDGPGGSYRWEVSPFDVAPPRMPIWMTAMLAPTERPRSAFTPELGGGDIEPLARFVAGSPRGERNNRLYWAACRTRDLVATGMVSEASSIQRLMMAAAACGLVGPEALRTIRSGLEAANKGAS